MPSEIVSLAVSTGIGVSVLAGILSGVCYVLAHGIKRKRNRRPSAQWHCSVCDGYLRSFEGVLEGDKVVTCTRCEGRVCKVRCSRRDTDSLGWICEICSKHSSWYQGILNILQPSSKVVYTQSKMNLDRIEELEDDLEAIRKKQKEQVREFIENIVTSMLGGDVDDVSVTKLYNDKQYLPVTGESPCTAHATLKKLIQRLLQEALELPRLKKAEDPPAVPEDENNRTYEDLLATAILNKVINNCQHNLPSSSANSVSSRLSTSSRNRDDGKEYFFGEETLDSKWKTTDLDSTSVSSLEEWIQSDSSLGSTKYVDRVSLTIQHRIEEVTPTDSEDEEEDAEYFKKSNSLLNDEDSNWFLQKRQFKGSHSPVPVPMLVPNPTSEVKVLIGDKEVDDTSDLSDVGSDYGETESYPEIKNVLIDSKKVIGGKNLMEHVNSNGNVSDDELSADSGVKVGSEPFEREFKTFEKDSKECVAPKADKTVDDDNIEDVSILSTYSNTEKDTEYTERYASLPRTILKSPPESLRNSTICHEDVIESTERCEDKEGEETRLNGHSEDDGYENIEFTGTYSKKEKEKWKHAIDMKNNPYSKENIEKRLREKGSVSSLFGSDYYARLASKPSGGKVKEDSSEPEVKNSNSESFVSSDKNDEITNEKDKYSAVPVKVIDENELAESEKIEPSLLPERKPEVTDGSDAEITLSLTSDSDLSYINCYDVENATVYRQTSGDTKLTVKPPKINGLLYKQTNEDEIILDMITKQLVYENHSSQYINKEMPLEVNIIRKDVTTFEIADPPQKLDSTPNKVNIIDATLKPNSKENAVDTDPVVVEEKILVALDTEATSENEVEIFSDAIEEDENDKATNTKVPETRIYLSKNVGNLLTKATAKNQNEPYRNSTKKPIVLNKKSDNTLIKKIYSDPSVRTFVLSSRDKLPVVFSDEKLKTDTRDKKRQSTPVLNSESELEEFSDSNTNRPFQRSISTSTLTTSKNYVVETIEPIQRSVSSVQTCGSEFSSDVNTSTLDSFEHDQVGDFGKQAAQVADPEIEELKEKKLVASILGEFSKSFPNVSNVHGVKVHRSLDDSNQSFVSLDNSEIKLSEEDSPVSVKDLKKMFEHPDTTSRKDKPIYSLTARSLSKQVREDLKNQHSDDLPSIEVVKCESTNPTPEPATEEVEEVTLNAENKIKFYEQLNK